MVIDDDLRTLSKWLNEEQLCPIDRSALARILAYVQDLGTYVDWQEDIDWESTNGD